MDLLRLVAYGYVESTDFDIVEDVNTSSYFGAVEDIDLEGTFVALWLKKDEICRRIESMEADYILKLADCPDDEIRLYGVNNLIVSDYA